MAKRKTPMQRANKFMLSKPVIGLNLLLLYILSWGAIETFQGKEKPFWLLVTIIIILLFNWTIWADALSKAEEDMYNGSS